MANQSLTESQNINIRKTQFKSVKKTDTNKQQIIGKRRRRLPYITFYQSIQLLIC